MQMKNNGEFNKEISDFKEKSMEKIFFLCAAMSVFFIVLISVFIFKGGFSFIREVGIKDFIFNTKWAPTAPVPSFGIGSMIVGSILVTLISSSLAIPVAIFTSTYLVFDCNKKLYKIFKSFLNLMAGIPSIVYGFFALNIIVPVMQKLTGGTGMSILTASILLFVMILPTIISVIETSLRAIPKSYYEGSIALGASHERSIVKVVLPAAKSGIFAGVILGVGRAIGETMAVILVAGNQTRFTLDIFKGIRTMTSNIVLEMGYAEGLHREALIATALVLFIFILIINIVFFIAKRRSERI